MQHRGFVWLMLHVLLSHAMRHTHASVSSANQYVLLAKESE